MGETDQSESRLSARAALVSRRSEGQKSLIPYLMAGYPNWSLFDQAVEILAAEGADVLELGVPFSDPLADGPTIQRASGAVLDAGVHLGEILEHVAERSGQWGIPIVLMSYVNPILSFGLTSFCRDAVSAGISGVLLSDLPPEELPELWQQLHTAGIETTLLVAPTTSRGRTRELARLATGFVYCVSRTGVTGQGGSYAANLGEQVEVVRSATDSPAVVGFGIRSAEDAARIAPSADGIVIGARMIEILERGAPVEAVLADLTHFVRGIRTALDGESAS